LHIRAPKIYSLFIQSHVPWGCPAAGSCRLPHGEERANREGLIRGSEFKRRWYKGSVSSKSSHRRKLGTDSINARGASRKERTCTMGPWQNL